MSDILMGNEMDWLRGENDRLKAEVVALNESRRSNLRAVDQLAAELAKLKAEKYHCCCDETTQCVKDATQLLTAELAKVKGELKELETEYSDREMVSDGEICCLGIDRDHWRGIAEKVKGELEKVSKFGADEMLRRGDAMAKQLFLIQDRDRWRGIAEGAREALLVFTNEFERAERKGYVAQLSYDMNEFAVNALAAFPPPGPKEPS